MVKKSLIAGIVVICALLLIFKVVTIQMLWALIFALPVLFFADLCFLSLPITIPSVLALSTYTLIKKDYQKYNYAYEILLVVVSTGIINYVIDKMLDNANYVNLTHCYRVYWLMLLLSMFIVAIINLAKFKDNRVYLWTFVPLIVFYMFFEIIKAAE